MQQNKQLIQENDNDIKEVETRKHIKANHFNLITDFRSERNEFQSPFLFIQIEQKRF